MHSKSSQDSSIRRVAETRTTALLNEFVIIAIVLSCTFPSCCFFRPFGKILVFVEVVHGDLCVTSTCGA